MCLVKNLLKLGPHGFAALMKELEERSVIGTYGSIRDIRRIGRNGKLLSDYGSNHPRPFPLSKRIKYRISVALLCAEHMYVKTRAIYRNMLQFLASSLSSSKDFPVESYPEPPPVLRTYRG
ncbi:hypothetical protein V6N13_092005 [Hibiscus sabdariffa]|uniref:Uncharacterized protein n=1 Tax=Hibiscus sabdariffa TaxID=183260 RepID=A0ABR2QFM7_9ROSI